MGHHPSNHGCSHSLDREFVVECKVVKGEEEKDEFSNVFKVDILMLSIVLQIFEAAMVRDIGV